MATVADLKRYGLALAGAEFFHLIRQPTLRVGKKTFAVWWEPDKRVVLKLERGHQIMLFEARPQIFSPCAVGTGIWSYVELPKLDRAALKDLVTEAWSQVTPTKTRSGKKRSPAPEGSVKDCPPRRQFVRGPPAKSN